MENVSSKMFSTSLIIYLFKMLKWREENEIDKLLDEEFPEFDQEYNVYLEGCDPLNRPVLSVPLGDWDIRR